MKVLFLDVVHEVLRKELEANSYECIDGTELEREKVVPILSDVDGIVIRSRFKMDESLLKHAAKLKFIARSGAGMENIDETYCETREIKLFNAPEGNRNAVGEHALGMLLALLNKLHVADRDVKKGLWQREKNRGLELDGKTVGIIGYGNNGSSFAKKLTGFDVGILAYDKYKTGFSNDHVKECTLKVIFEEADVVSFHIPQNEETRFMCNKPFLNAFRKPIFLLNLSRGKIVETKALLDAINKEQVLGAGLDVLEYEKSSFENMFEGGMSKDFRKLLTSDQVILSPHVGGWTHESYRKLSQVLADKILTHFDS